MFGHTRHPTRAASPPILLPRQQCVLEECCGSDVHRAWGKPWVHIWIFKTLMGHPMGIAAGLLIHLSGIPSGIASLESPQSGMLFLAPSSRSWSYGSLYCCPIFSPLPYLLLFVLSSVWTSGERHQVLWTEHHFTLRKTCVGAFLPLKTGYFSVSGLTLKLSFLICKWIPWYSPDGLARKWKQCMPVRYLELN